MKIEKINENKLKIILTLDELEKREISLKDLESDTTLAKELFLALIEENNLDEEFKLDNSQLLIEASSDCENLFVVTITKLDINIKPISLNKDFGTMLYDVFDIRNNTPLSPKNKDEILNPTYYHAVAKNGIIEVPPYSEILNENNVYSNIPVEKKGEFYV